MEYTHSETTKKDQAKENKPTERVHVETIIKNQSKPRVVKNFFSSSEVTELDE